MVCIIYSHSPNGLNMNSHRREPMVCIIYSIHKSIR